jgi:hypothetical protein
MPNGFSQRQSQAKGEKKPKGRRVRNPRRGNFHDTTIIPPPSWPYWHLAAGLCPICCTEPQVAGSPAASMYQYGACAGIRCDTSVLVPAVTLLVRETPPARREKKRWPLGGAAGVPRPVPKAACPCPRARLSPRPAFSALN